MDLESLVGRESGDRLPVAWPVNFAIGSGGSQALPASGVGNGPAQDAGGPALIVTCAFRP